MKLTAFTDYSLRVLIYLAAQPERRATVAEISTAFGIKVNHLTKVVHHLGRRDWVETARGKGGGLLLAKPADAICIGQVVRDTEGAALPAECFSDPPGQCVIDGRCRLKGVLSEAVQAFYTVLDRYTLADVTHNRALLAEVLTLHGRWKPRPAAASMPGKHGPE